MSIQTKINEAELHIPHVAEIDYSVAGESLREILAGDVHPEDLVILMVGVKDPIRGTNKEWAYRIPYENIAMFIKAHNLRFATVYKHRYNPIH